MGVPEDDDDSHVGLLASDGSVPSGLGIHLTPTKKGEEHMERQPHN